MTVKKAVLKSPKFWIGIVMAFLPLIPKAQEYVNANFEVLNTLLAMIFGAFGVSDAAKKVEEDKGITINSSKRY